MNLLPKKEKRYICYLFSESHVKIGKIGGEKKELEIFFEFALPPGIISGGEVKDVEKLAKLLQDIKASTKIKENLVVLGVPETKASTRTLLLPPLDIKEIDQAIKFQAESFLPFPYDSEYVDWMLVETTSDGKKKVLVSAVPKSIIDAFVAAFRKAGLHPIAFESTTLSLLRLVPRENRQQSFITEVDNESTIAVLNKDGDLEACSVVEGKENFIETLKKMCEYYVSGVEGKNKPIIYLCGNGVDNALIEQIKTLRVEPILLKTNVGRIPQGRELDLSVFVSLLQKPVALPEDEKTINILPSQLAQQYKLSKEEEIEKALSLILFTLLLVLNISVFSFYFRINAQIRGIEEQTAKEESGGKSIQELQKYSEKIKLINEFSPQKKLLTRVINDIWLTPKDSVRITGFNYSEEKGELTLGGKAASREGLLLKREELEKLGIFKKVSIPLSSLEKEVNLDFRIEAIIK